MKTLAIESTCDDTSIAIVSYDDGVFVVDEMITHTQGMHQQYGGVVPEFASRAHAESFVDVIQRMDIDRGEIDSITVASQPGLPGSITMGVTTAHTLGSLLDKPVIEVNHIMGHVFSILLDRSLDILKAPYLCLTVSGGHSDVYIVEQIPPNPPLSRGEIFESRSKRGHIGIGESVNVGPYTVTKIVQTMDDAVGEAFDKVAKMLGGPYPGGKWVGERAIHRESKAETRDIEEIIIQRLRTIDVSEQFSFSGIKAQVHSLLEYLKRQDIALTQDYIALICRRFQEVVTDALVRKLDMEQQIYSPSTIGVVGGVSANKRLMEQVHTLGTSLGVDIYVPAQLKYTGDNASMIGVVGLLEVMSQKVKEM